MTAATTMRAPRPRVIFSGVAAESPFGSMLCPAVASSLAHAMCGAPANAPRRWKHMVTGTDLQWWGPQVHSTVTATPEDGIDIVVDLFGEVPLNRNRRVWRVVDSRGKPVLSPFFMLEDCCRPARVASLFLIEHVQGASDWAVIGEAHLSNRQRYRFLLAQVARAAANLIVNALFGDGDRSEGCSRMVIAAKRRSRFEIATGRLRARVREFTTIVSETVFNEYWVVGTLSAPVRALLRSQTLCADRWLPCDEHAYFADPFPSPDDPNVIFCERFDYRSDRGQLRAITVSDQGVAVEQPVDVNLVNSHMSYPQVFRQGGRLLLLPEMAASGKLILFELLPDGSARSVCVVNRGTRIADPTLFRHGDLYWIAYCDQDFGNCNNLCLMYSPRIDGPWNHHPNNPVKVDIRSCRPAGSVFTIDGRVFRPAQDCSRTYGGAVVVNEVLTCTPAHFAERTAAVLTPDSRGPCPHGLHTVNIGSDRILIDGKRLFFDPGRLVKRMRSYVRRHYGL